MAKAIYLQFSSKKRRTKVVLSEQDIEVYLATRPSLCNRGYVKRQFKDTKDKPTHTVLPSGILTKVSEFIKAR